MLAKKKNSRVDGVMAESNFVESILRTIHKHLWGDEM